MNQRLQTKRGKLRTPEATVSLFTDHSAPKVGMPLRGKCVFVSKFSSEAAAQRFCPKEEVGFKIESSESLPKGMEFIGNIELKI